ncbi:unnamed protein product, partial [Iphiclides podalirius]
MPPDELTYWQSEATVEWRSAIWHRTWQTIGAGLAGAPVAMPNVLADLAPRARHLAGGIYADVFGRPPWVMAAAELCLLAGCGKWKCQAARVSTHKANCFAYTKRQNDSTPISERQHILNCLRNAIPPPPPPQHAIRRRNPSPTEIEPVRAGGKNTPRVKNPACVIRPLRRQPAYWNFDLATSRLGPFCGD